MKLKLPERRRFVRVDIPLELEIKSDSRTEKVLTKNISPVGFMFETAKKFEDSEDLDMILVLPSGGMRVGIKGRIMWQNKISLEDGAPFNIGVDLVEIGDDNKNAFLKYLCDVLYESTYKERS